MLDTHETIASKPPMFAYGALLVAALVLTMSAGVWALAVEPFPFSDWKYYWDAAAGNIRYERGGVMIFVLRFLQLFDPQPHMAALYINLAAAFVILSASMLSECRRSGVAVASALVFTYLLAITPYYAVVQFDLAATAMLCVGFYLLALNKPRAEISRKHLLGMAMIALAVSCRPQFFLILLAFGAMLMAAEICISRFRKMAANRTIHFALATMLAAMVGFGIDSLLRAQAGRAEAVRTNSAVTLYAGLLSSEAAPPTCGHWSVKASQEARDDAQAPLLQTIKKRLSAHPLPHWLQVIRCKIPHILMPTSYAVYWSLDSPNVVARIKSGNMNPPILRWTSRVRSAEASGFHLLLKAIYLFTGVMVIVAIRQKQWLAATMPLVWVASFWLVHSVFEIQARYFLSLFLLMPFMTMLGVGRIQQPVTAQ